jgi:hypothetical protein
MNARSWDRVRNALTTRWRDESLGSFSLVWTLLYTYRALLGSLVLVSQEVARLTFSEHHVEECRFLGKGSHQWQEEGEHE